MDRSKKIKVCVAFYQLMRMRHNNMMLNLVLTLIVYFRQRNTGQLSLGGRMNTRIRRDALERIIGEGDRNCVWELRMNTNVFANLCEVLQTHGGLVEDGRVSLPEQVATFLIILAHHKKTVVFSILFVKPTPVEEEYADPKWNKFKGCLGALDGTYIEITVPESDKSRYKTRKGKVCTNVLGVCNRDMSLFMCSAVGKDPRPIQEYSEMRSHVAIASKYLMVITT
ncbi:hypothetical protein PIB30_080109 [Stylosanthes scabra]|uniref:DUF8040 domain-containing protein n=1 Tax=Stylosanthes scabra TaxID=79078 RepID=A0ABU6VPT1_9FABA|nr:hypothetical protein [Stylosanthes scabra]